MDILYFDLSMGAAGDMLSAALLDTMDEPGKFAEEFNTLGIPHVRMVVENSEKCGVTGLHVKMLIDGHEEGEHGHAHHHRRMTDVSAIINSLSIPPEVKSDALAVYESIAQAEAKVHGETVEQVHFHEVGALDAIADVVAFSMLICRLSPETVFASPVHVGSGTVRCAHGILPVPAPATAELLKGIPNYGGEIKGELCTPTGAALLRHFVKIFGPQPQMSVERTGCGMGTKNFPTANCVRALVGKLR